MSYRVERVPLVRFDGGAARLFGEAASHLYKAYDDLDNEPGLGVRKALNRLTARGSMPGRSGPLTDADEWLTEPFAVDELKRFTVLIGRALEVVMEKTATFRQADESEFECGLVANAAVFQAAVVNEYERAVRSLAAARDEIQVAITYVIQNGGGS